MHGSCCLLIKKPLKLYLQLTLLFYNENLKIAKKNIFFFQVALIIITTRLVIAAVI